MGCYIDPNITSTIGVLEEDKVIGGIYKRELSGYRVTTTEAPTPHRVGIMVF